MQNKHFNIDIKMAGKRIKALFMSAILLLGTFSMLLLTGCSSDTGYDDDRISIVCTTFPQYDWLSQIIGDNSDKFRLTLLINGGVDLHSYQPSAKDMTKISSADVFVYVGGESDAWVLDAVRETKNKDMIKVNMMELISDRTKEEEVIEGMQESRFQFRHTHTHSHSTDDHTDEHSDDHTTDDHADDHSDDHTTDDRSDDHADEHSDDHTADDHADEYTAGDHSEDNYADDHSLEAGHSHTDEDIEYDEHIWLSLKNAAVLTQYLADIVKDLDKDNSQLYQDNADAYINKLAGLDSDYENVCENSRLKTVIFGDRFPFRYLVDDYGIDYYAAFAGCSAETEASFKTVTFLSGKIDEIGTGSILVIDGSDKRIANTIKGNTSQKNQQILTMDSMQSAGTDDADYTYLNVMSNNLVVLKQALQ